MEQRLVDKVSFVKEFERDLKEQIEGRTKAVVSILTNFFKTEQSFNGVPLVITQETRENLVLRVQHAFDQVIQDVNQVVSLSMD